MLRLADRLFPGRRTPPIGATRQDRRPRAGAAKNVRITHVPTGTVLAEGPVGWGITPFEGNYYIRKRYLKTDRLRPSFIPGFCPYKFLYVWLDLIPLTGQRVRGLAWYYWLPNPLLPFIAFRVAVPGGHPEVRVEVLG